MSLSSSAIIGLIFIPVLLLRLRGAGKVTNCLKKGLHAYCLVGHLPRLSIFFHNLCYLNKKNALFFLLNFGVLCLLDLRFSPFTPPTGHSWSELVTFIIAHSGKDALDLRRSIEIRAHSTFSGLLLPPVN